MKKIYWCLEIKTIHLYSIWWKETLICLSHEQCWYFGSNDFAHDIYLMIVVQFNGKQNIDPFHSVHPEEWYEEKCANHGHAVPLPLLLILPRRFSVQIDLFLVLMLLMVLHLHPSFHRVWYQRKMDVFFKYIQGGVQNTPETRLIYKSIDILSGLSPKSQSIWLFSVLLAYNVT